jgi:hypothetical protein
MPSRTRKAPAAVVAAAVAVVMALTGCSLTGNSEHIVFAVASGFTQGGLSNTKDVINIGVPGLKNISGNTVKLSSVVLVSPPRALKVVSTTAYLYSQTRSGIGITHGNYLKNCKQLTPYAVSDVSAKEHSWSHWLVVIAVKITKPGKYYLGRVKINYLRNGNPGWQYQNLYTTLTITQAGKSTKPGFDGCP